jgi:uncharacterized protein
MHTIESLHTAPKQGRLRSCPFMQAPWLRWRPLSKGKAVLCCIARHVVSQRLIASDSWSIIKYFCRAMPSRRSFVRNIGQTPEGGAMRAIGIIALFLVFGITVVHGRAIAQSLGDAAHAGDVAKVQELIAAGSDVDERDQSNETPLIKAALARQAAVAAALIEAGADIKARNDRGFTALHAAAYSGSVEIATMLLDRGMPVDDHAERAITPLHVAAEENQFAVVELLLARGAEIEAVQGNGYTPLTAATYMQSTDVMALLKRHGAKCQPADFMGKGAYDECAAAGK